MRNAPEAFERMYRGEHTHPHDTIHLAWVDAHGRQHSATVQLAAQPEK